MQLFKFNKLIHKWLSIVVGIQLLIWLGTGLYFNLMDHATTAGNANRQEVIHRTNTSAELLIPVSDLNVERPQKITLIWLLEQPFYRVVTYAGAHSYQAKAVTLWRAVSGEQFHIDGDLAQSVALQSFKGSAEVESIALLQPPITELPREENAVWQIRLDDELATNVYIDNTTGQVIAHVNDDRRLRDLMFKLHFMDYGNSGGFNHWLIIMFAVAALVLSVTGVFWLVQLYKEGQLSLRVTRGQQSVTLLFSKTGEQTTLLLPKQKSVLDGLAELDMLLPSSCGGGGTCGRCVIRSSENLNVSAAEHELLSQKKLSQGFRLGCQHLASEVNLITVVSKIKSNTESVTDDQNSAASRA